MTISNVSKPLVGITMGDAAGVGPEIIVKALADASLHDTCRPLVIGDAKMLRRAKALVGSEIVVHPVSPPESAKYESGTIDCLDLDLLPDDLVFGQVSAAAGDAAFRFLEKAVELAKAGQIGAICTAPLNKEAMRKAGHSYPGHTEILAEMTGTPEVAMMFASPALNIILVTIHVGLIEAVRLITPERVYRTILLARDALVGLGLDSPRIAVCGINPHAGESGLFGRNEEEEKIVPALERARSEGLRVFGPLPGDTVFYRAKRGDFDIVVAMYHDQGLAPVKTLDLENAVNITVGLPIIRTSVVHGTAFDIAGKGRADAENMKVAVRYAARLAGAPGPLRVKRH